MGIDATFHAISKEELKSYVFDVINDPEHAIQLTSQLAIDFNKLVELHAFYQSDLNPWSLQLTYGDWSDDIGSNFAIAVAVISGYLHPFFYARNFNFSLMSSDYPEIKQFFTSLTQIEGSPLKGLCDEGAGLISANYCASGVAKNPSELMGFLERHKQQLGQKYDQDDIESLRSALTYAIDNELWFLEASEIVTPIIGECLSDKENLNAYFMNPSLVNSMANSNQPETNDSYRAGLKSHEKWVYAVIALSLSMGLLSLFSDPQIKDLIRLGLNVLLCYYLFKARSWARWVMGFLFVAGGAASLMSVFLSDGLAVNKLLFPALGLIYLLAGFVLFSSKFTAEYFNR